MGGMASFTLFLRMAYNKHYNPFHQLFLIFEFNICVLFSFALQAVDLYQRALSIFQVGLLSVFFVHVSANPPCFVQPPFNHAMINLLKYSSPHHFFS